jgi:hypothetical protein
MIDNQFNGTGGLRSVPEFEEGQPVSGRRWGEQELITGRFVKVFGTDGVAMLVQLASGDTAAIVAQTASTAGRHRAELLLPQSDDATSPDRAPLPPAEEPAEQTQVLNPAEVTAFEPVTGRVDDLDEDAAEQDPWAAAPVWPLDDEPDAPAAEHYADEQNPEDDWDDEVAEDEPDQESNGVLAGLRLRLRKVRWTTARVVLLTTVVAVSVTWGAAWLVMGR